MLVQLEGSSPKSWATTDPAFQGGTDPEWNEKLNNELELFYDASLHEKDAVLTVEVYSDETGEELIGTGQINVAKIAKNQTKSEYCRLHKVIMGCCSGNANMFLCSIESHLLFQLSRTSLCVSRTPPAALRTAAK